MPIPLRGLRVEEYVSLGAPKKLNANPLNFLYWSALILNFLLLSRFYRVVSSNSKKTLIGGNNEARYDQVYWVSHKHAFTKKQVVDITTNKMTNATWRQNFKVGQSLPFLPFSVFRIGGLNSSVILTSLDYNNYTGKLLSYLEPVLLSSEWSRFVKCWHAKTDGWAASTFHSNCDGRGPTVTIIKVNDYIFGGYTDVSWGPSGEYVFE